MKWSLMMRANTLQVNLTPENEHERAAMKILRAHSGNAAIHAGVQVEECRGGYLRNFGERDDDVAITITKRPEDGPPA